MTDTPVPDLEKQISADLVARIGAGDKRAERQLCEHYYRRLLYFIRKRTRGDAALAEDICQQTFIQALEKLRGGHIRDPASLGTWLHGIAVHDLMNEVRKTERRATHADTELIERAADTEASPLDRISDTQLRVVLGKYLAQLSPTDRDVLIRLYLKEEDRESICASEGYSPRQLNNIAWRARQRLRQQMLEELEDAGRGASRVVSLMR